MKIIAEAQFLVREAVQGKKDPSKTYYNATFLQGAETLQISATKEAYDQLETYNQLEVTRLNIDYNSQYKTLRLMSVGA